MPPNPTALLLSNPTPCGMAGFIHKSVFLDLTVCKRIPCPSYIITILQCKALDFMTKQIMGPCG